VAGGLDTMAETTVFDILVRSMNSQERRSLLERIRASAEVPPAPLRPDDDQEDSVDLDTEYRRMSLLQRIVILLRALFTGHDRQHLLEQVLLRRVETLVERHGTGLVYYRKRMFGARLYDELAALRLSVQYLKGPLDVAMRQEKEDFVAFLAGIEMAETQARLMEATDPRTQWRDDAGLDSGSFRADLMRRCEEIVDGIPKDTRRGVYYDVQALTALTRLSVHPFGAMLSCFRATNSAEERSCGFAELARYLVSLSEVLSGVRFAPSQQALRALFLFGYKENLLDPAFKVEEHLEGDFYNVESTLNGIREFNEAVPLDLIVKYATGNLGYRPKPQGGAEDWFALYKSFWKRRLARSYSLFFRQRMEERLAARAVAYLGVPKLPELAQYNREHFGEGVLPAHALSLAFLSGFFQQVFGRVSRPLRIIVTSGDFYKQENRNELNDSLAYLALIDENIASLEKRLAKDGDLGMALADADSERRSPSMRVKRLRAVVDQADRNAAYLVSECYKKLYTLTQVLEGIMHGKSSERYDTLANLSAIGGVGNRLLVSAWGEALEQLRAALALLREMRDLEESALKE
jgi:hypothetical protein